MNEILSFLTLRTVAIFASTTFAVLFIMLTLNIVTVDEVAVILKMGPEATNALKLIISRVQEVSSNLLDILSQLLNKLFGWAGVDIDLHKIKVDVNQTPNSSGLNPATPVVPTPPSSGSSPINN